MAAKVSPFLPCRRNKYSWGIQPTSQVRALQAREEPWHSLCASRGWMAWLPSRSPDTILLPKNQHRQLVMQVHHTCSSGDKIGGKHFRELSAAQFCMLSLPATRFSRNYDHKCNFCLCILWSCAVSSAHLYPEILFLKTPGRISWQEIVPKLQKQMENTYLE